MADYTKNTPGAPDAGQYAIGDTVRDSVGVTWKCVAAGLPGVFVPSGVPVGLASVGSPSAGNIGTLASGVTMRDDANGAYHTTVLTLSDLLVPVADANAYGGTKLGIFPQGRIYVTGVIARLTWGANGVRASTINNSSTIDWAMGTVTASNVVLSSTMVNLAPAVDEAAVGDDAAYGAETSSVLAAAAFFDGTATAIDIFLNAAFSDATDIDADGVLKAAGMIQITWQYLGDK